jgi:electron-transferring-flavoprotein dehydrogenase
VDGALLVGDAGGLCNSLRLKGVHLAVQSGLAAGDALAAGWPKKNFSATALQGYPQQLQTSTPWKELQQIRNVRASFHYGLLPGMLAVGASLVSGGALPPGKMSFGPDADALHPKAGARPYPTPPAPQPGEAPLQLDKLSDLFFSKTQHEENQPSHLKILDPEKCKRCIEQYGAPCTRFCPAQVYVLPPGGQEIHVDFSNCLHCKTCQIKDPLRNIQWTAPEGGGGPLYTRM